MIILLILPFACAIIGIGYLFYLVWSFNRAQSRSPQEFVETKNEKYAQLLGLLSDIYFSKDLTLEAQISNDIKELLVDKYHALHEDFRNEVGQRHYHIVEGKYHYIVNTSLEKRTLGQKDKLEDELDDVI